MRKCCGADERTHDPCCTVREAQNERDEALKMIRALVLVEANRAKLTPGSAELGLAMLTWNNAQALLHRHGVLMAADASEVNGDADYCPCCGQWRT